ncbi:MAG: SDR family oxidoreductase, partial [Chloroflexi bacterium]|nr:SDR family oxidoreductase [Chloroflexota bacterium]
ITGGARGIGRAIGLALAADAYRVALVDLNGETAQATAREIAAVSGLEGAAYQADVRDYARAQEIVADLLARFGRVDALINNAGITSPTPFPRLTEADWDLVIGVHLKGSFNYAHAVVPSMLAAQWGRIVCISSMNAKHGGAFPAVSKTAYAAAKAGMLGLIRGLARDLAPHITANAVCPGLIATELSASMWAGPQAQAVIDSIPAGRLGLPEDVANAVAFLASEKAGYISGEAMDVNGAVYID